MRSENEAELRPGKIQPLVGFIRSVPKYADFFFLNGKDAPAAYFMASRGKRDWLVQQFEPPLGTVLHHYFGPLPWIERTVTGPDGTEQGDKGRGNWAYARRILLALWDELRALSASI